MKAADLRNVLPALPPRWAAVLPGWTPERLAAIGRCLEATSGDRDIAPDDPYRALRLVDPEDVKVVVIGQDPYPTAGHADGLAFSAGRGRPRSLARIFDVLAEDRPASFRPPAVWKLDDWARQGVLLLNPVLTVEVGRSGSHTDCGWQALTLEIVEWLSQRREPPVFLLWGSKARAFVDSGVRSDRMRVLVTRHPSYDFRREFMADGSHFAATAHLVDWWGIGTSDEPVL